MATKLRQSRLLVFLLGMGLAYLTLPVASFLGFTAVNVTPGPNFYQLVETLLICGALGFIIYMFIAGPGVQPIELPKEEPLWQSQTTSVTYSPSKPRKTRRRKKKDSPKKK